MVFELFFLFNSGVNFCFELFLMRADKFFRGFAGRGFNAAYLEV